MNLNYQTILNEQQQNDISCIIFLRVEFGHKIVWAPYQNVSDIVPKVKDQKFMDSHHLPLFQDDLSVP